MENIVGRCFPILCMSVLRAEKFTIFAAKIRVQIPFETTNFPLFSEVPDINTEIDVYGCLHVIYCTVKQ